MAVDSTGTKNEPIFFANGSPEVDVDPTAVAAYAAKVGNRRVGTTAERTAATGKDVWEGLEWFDTDLDEVFIYLSGGWTEWAHDWKAYTSTPTNVSGGTLTGRFRRNGKRIDVHIRHVLAAAGVIGQPSYTLPVNAADAALEWLNGTVLFADASPGTEFLGVVRKSDAGLVRPYALAASTSYVQFVNVSATVPFTWAVNDIIDLQFSYEAA